MLRQPGLLLCMTLLCSVHASACNTFRDAGEAPVGRDVLEPDAADVPDAAGVPDTATPDGDNDGGPDASDCAPEAERCDGQDNDCDGHVDEDCGCVSGGSQSCCSGPAGTQDVGECSAGIQTCSGGQWGACVAEVLPTAELCDDLDNDCVNGIDDPCDNDNDDRCEDGLQLVGTPATCSLGGGDCDDEGSAVGDWWLTDGYEPNHGFIQARHFDSGNGTTAPWTTARPTTFHTASDLDAFVGSSSNAPLAFWVCRVSGLAPDVTLDLHLGWRGSDYAAGAVRGEKRAIVADGAFVTLPTPFLPGMTTPYHYYAEVKNSTGATHCDATYTLECKRTNSSVW